MSEYSNLWDIGQANKNKYPSYLATPNGSLQKYDPKTGKTVVVNNNMPSDVKDPTRKNKVSSRETKKYNVKDELEWQNKIDQEAANERIINIR